MIEKEKDGGGGRKGLGFSSRHIQHAGGPGFNPQH